MPDSLPPFPPGAAAAAASANSAAASATTATAQAALAGTNAATGSGALSIAGATAFQVADDIGNVVLQVDGSGLTVNALLAAIVTLTGSLSAAGGIDVGAGVLGAGTLAPNSFELADQVGNVGLRLDGTGLTVASLITGALSLSGAFSTNGSLDFGAATLASYADSNVALVLADPAGWIIAAVTSAGTLQVGSVKTTPTSTSSDYSVDEIAERNARALGTSAAIRGRMDAAIAGPAFGLNHFSHYGQSLKVGQEGWPAKSRTAVPDTYMVGNSERPGVYDSASYTPLGGSTLTPLVATNQGVNGSLVSDSAVAALSPGDATFGESSPVAATMFARRLFLQNLGLAAASDRKFVVTNAAVGGKTVAALSKAATPTEYFNRLRDAATLVKTLAGSSTAGCVGFFYDQGEADYSAGTTVAAYKAALIQLRADFNADVAVGIYGQADMPAMFTYQTGGSFTYDGVTIGEAQFELSMEQPSWYLCCPDYPYSDKASGHRPPNTYRWIGLQEAKVFNEVVVRRRGWRPTSPLQITWRGSTVLIDFHAPSGALQFQPVYVQDVATSYANLGFTVVDALGTAPLAGVTIVGDVLVQIACGRALIGPVSVLYANHTTNDGRGNLCDTDATSSLPYTYSYVAGSGDYASANIAGLVGLPYPLWNWCVAFNKTATAN